MKKKIQKFEELIAWQKARDVGYLEKQSFESLMTQAIEVGTIVGGLRAAVERKRRKEIEIAR